MKINWSGSKTIGGREVLEGKTVINGKSYTVKVSYNSSALKTKFDEGTDLNKKIDVIFKKIDDSDFERLEGYKFRTSLQKIKGKRSFSVVKGSDEVNLDDLKKDKREFYNSIKSVNKVFLDCIPKKTEEKKAEDGIEIEVAEDAEAKKPNLKSLKDQLSNKNPAKKDDKLLDNIFKYNQAKKEELKKEILEKIKKITSDDFKYEVVRLMEDKEIQQEFRIALGFVKRGDIVCSKGQIDFKEVVSKGGSKDQGHFACGPICLKAIERLMQGKKIDSENIIEALIREGVRFHVRVMNEKAEQVDDLLSKFNKDTKSEKLKKNEELDDTVAGNIDKIMHHLTEDAFKGHYCLLTFPVDEKQFGKTVFAYYSGKKFYLFDSHRTTQNNVTGFGATLRGFDTANDLGKHLQENYIKRAKSFEYHFISQA